MTLANKVTIARLCLIPVFVLSYYLCLFEWTFVPAIVFAIASFTDFLDGYLARSRNEVTVFGKFMDPIADKVLVMSAFVLLVMDGRLSAVACIIFLAREFIISGFRLVAAGGNIVIAASNLAKVKTVTQIVAVILLLLNNWPFSYLHIPMDSIAVWVSLIFTIWSGTEYIVKNRHLLAENKGENN